MAKKQYRLRADQIVTLVPTAGCYASDKITVDGSKVGYMYREEPDFEGDCGWRFLSGDESQDYLDDLETLHIAIYDLNTIANYDPEIIRLLDAPIGSSFERDEDSGEFVEIEEE